MSVRKILITVFVLSAPSLVFAENIFKDPLRTRPPVLETGSVLPGDSATLKCPAALNIEAALTLPDAIDLALCNNGDIRQAWVEIKVKADQLGLARSAYLPNISGTISRLRTHTTFPNSEFNQPNESYWGTTKYLSLSWNLLDFGGRTAQHKSAKFLLNAALFAHQAKIQESLSKVVEAYFDAVTAQAQLKSNQDIANLTRRTVSSVMNKEALGVAKVGDTLQASISLSKAKLELQRSQSKFVSSMANLSYVLGLSSDQKIILPDMVASKQPVKENVKVLKEWLQEAEKHPAIAQAKAKLAAAKKDVRAAQSDGLPTVALNANYYQNGYPGQAVARVQSNQTTVGVVLNVPIFSGFNKYYKIREAQDKVEASEVELKGAEQQVAVQILTVHGEAISALDNLQASNTLFETASLLLDSTQRRYANGAADVIELVNAQNTYAESRQERIHCLADWQTAKWRLLASVGQLGREKVQRDDVLPN